MSKKIQVTNSNLLRDAKTRLAVEVLLHQILLTNMKFAPIESKLNVNYIINYTVT